MGTNCLLGFLLLNALLSQSDSGLLRKIIRHRRRAPPSAEDNATLSDGDKHVVFNHVYNINVPGASSTCSVDLDAPGSLALDPRGDTASSSSSSSGLREHAANGENQIVFTHRINIPRQACGCADGFPDLKDLVNRLEVLEGELSTLRNQCAGESGCCTSQAAGEVGTKPYCNGHGNYSSSSCGCVCEPGWTGQNCTEPKCPDDCHDQGRCVEGRCECFGGFGGEDCGQKTCPAACGRNGQCLGGRCVCLEGFSGDDCSRTSCPDDCLGRGLCRAGACVCDAPWAGLDCSELICPNDCYDRGRCANGTCRCDEGYAGEDCGERLCPADCHGNGFCVDGRCVCGAGYGGDDCSRLSCLRGCSGRGTCVDGLCVCDRGYRGEDCGRAACPDDCNRRGQCVDGRCACDVGFQGEACAELSCPDGCLGRGRCVNGQCVCEEGFAGEDCRVRTCPAGCYGRGECADGRCACFPGFAGEDCGELSCPGDCGRRGRCVDGQCVCDEGYAGGDCGRRACPNDCLGRGRCVDGECACREGYAGDDCAVAMCPEDCSGRGRCVGGKCRCEDGYGGESCGELSCPDNCQGKGHCVEGRCVCDEGYVGEDCSDVSPPKDLAVTDVTPKTVGLSWNNDKLVTEYVVSYVPTGHGGLRRELNVPGDRTSATITELEPGIEYLINVYAVLSNKKSVPISARVSTSLPQPGGLKFKSVGESSVEVQWEQLDITFDGWELFFRNTKEENGKIVNVLPPTLKNFSQSGLGPGQEYEVTLSVIKNNTRGPQTSRKFTTKIAGPRRVEVRDVTDSSARLTWSRPVTDVGAIVVTVSYAPASDPTETSSVELPGADAQYSVGGLRPDTEYRVSLTSRRGDLRSDPVTQTFTTALDAPRHLQTQAQTDDSITLEWSNSLADVGSYRVKYSPLSGGSHSEELIPRGSGESTQATITGLEPGTEYGIGVTAVKDERESVPATTNAATDLDPPKDLEVTDVAETALTLQWQRPRAKVAGYRLAYVSREGQGGEVELPGTATSHALDGLSPGTLYNLALTAETGPKRSSPVTLAASTASFTFYSAHSNVPEVATHADPEDNLISFVHLDTPESPASGMGPGDGDERPALSVSGRTSDGFDLSWDLKPRGVYDSLVVEYSGTQRSLDVTELHLRGDSAGSRIQGLNASTEYHVVLYGIKSNKRVPLLEALASTAPEPISPGVNMSVKDVPTTTQFDVKTVATVAPPHTVTPPPPPPPPTSGPEQVPPNLESLLGDLTVANVTSASAGVGWSAAPGQTFDAFLVEVTDLSGTTRPRAIAVPGGVRSAEIEGLLPSTRYDIALYGLVGEQRTVPLKGFINTDELIPRVVNLTIADLTWDSFNVSWRVNDGDFETFVIEITNLENLAESQNLTLSGDASSLLVSGLATDTTYMVALYGMHQGSFLEPVYNEATTVSKPMVGNLYVSNLTSTSFSISWNGTEGEVDGYVLEIIDSDWLRQPEEYNISHSVMSYDITGLKPSTDYIAYLYGVLKGSRTNAASIVASTAQEPDLSRLVVSNITSDRFSLSWKTGGKAFDNFIVEVRESALPTQAMGRSLAGGRRRTLMAGLKASTTYDIKLYGSVDGQKSQPLFAVATTGLVPSNKAREPIVLRRWYHAVSLRHESPRLPVSVEKMAEFCEDVPQLGTLSATSVNPDNLTLSWNTVSGHFHGFVIRVSDSERLFDTLEYRPPSHVRNLTVSNLVDATGYDIELYGISHGRQTPSVFTHAVTAPLPRVENMTVSNITPHGFRVSWETKQAQQESAPSGGGFSHFHLVVTDSGWLLEPQEFTVPGNETHLDLWGLITGIGYEVRLTGVSKSGLLSRPLTTVAVTEAEPEIEHLFVSDITAESFRLSWTAIEDLFDRFVIKIRDTKKLAHPQEYNTLGDERTKVLTGLTSDTEYEIELYGVSLEQRSQPITGVAQTGLGSPRGIHFSDVTDTSAIAQWAVPPTRVDSYRVTYVPLPEGAPMSVTVDGTESQAVLPNMIPGKSYQVTVTAVKGLEESFPATEQVTTGLGSPRGIHFSDVTDTSAIAQWAVPPSRADSYRVTYVPLQEGAPMPGASMSVTVDGTESQALLPNMIPGKTYQVMVTAVKGQEESFPAAEQVTTGLGSPRGIHFSDVTDTSAIAQWAVPPSRADSYRVTYVPLQEGAPMTGASMSVTVDGTESQALLPNMIPGKTYQVTVTAVKGQEESSAATDQVTTGLGSPRGIHFSDVTDTSAIAQWAVPPTRADSYRVTYVPLQEGAPMPGASMSVTVDGTESQALLPNMIPGKSYQVTVTAVKGQEESSAATDQVTTALDSPQSLVALNVTEMSALLLWQPSVANVDGYVITYSADAVSPIIEHVSGNTVEFEMGSLVPGSRYTVGVYAMKDAEKSESATVDFTTDVDPPRDLAAYNIQTDSATLTWKPPRSAVTGYTLSFSSPDGAPREVVLSPTATSYSLSQLTGSTEYSAALQAVAAGLKSPPVSTVFTTIGRLYRHPKDCAQALVNGESSSGLHTIYVGGEGAHPIQVYCDMTTDGGGWLVFLRRQNGKLEFFRNWKNYTGGFGSMHDEFWLGLSNLHKITNSGHYELRVDLRDNEDTAYAQYDRFTIAEPRTRYKVYVGAYSGTAGDSMTYHQGRPFSTYDNDNDIAVTNCALSYNGAFWYKNCHRVNLMGKYGDVSHSKGINWFHWRGHEHSIPFAEMKIRPANFTNFESRRKRS